MAGNMEVSEKIRRHHKQVARRVAFLLLACSKNDSGVRLSGSRSCSILPPDEIRFGCSDPASPDNRRARRWIARYTKLRHGPAAILWTQLYVNRGKSTTARFHSMGERLTVEHVYPADSLQRASL
jgi:hypothetical protein